MKKAVIIFLLLLYLCSILPVSVLGTDSVSDNPPLLSQQPLAAQERYNGTAKAVILYERNTRTLLFSHNPDESINPTGLVKLLTALIVLEEGTLTDVVTVQRSTLNSVSPGAVSAGLKAGEEITLNDLLYCVMVSSANDAAAVMAEHVAGSQEAFVEKMNARAATLGCVNTHFTNVHGLKDDRQHSTARDLAIILDEALNNPRFVEFFGAISYSVPATNMSDARSLRTTNYMMDPDSKYYDERVTGGKPAAATTSDRSMACVATMDGSQYLCVVISAKARMSGSAVTRYTNFDEASDLLDMGFQQYAIQQVLGVEQPYGLYPVSGGENHVVVGPDQALFALLPIDFDPGQLQFWDVRLEEQLVAPLPEGTCVGTLQIYYGSVHVGSVNLLARHDVALLGTTITADDSSGEAPAATFWRILKWTGIVLLVLLVLAFCVILTIRRIHVKQYHQRNKVKN